MQVRILFTMPAGLGRRIVAAASAALALLASPAHAEPAMWVVKDADSTLYLLGTVHLIKPGMNWQTDKIEAAFKASDEYWMEATNNGDMAMMGPLIISHGYDLTRPLSSKLNGDDWARVQSAAKTAGLPISTVERMRPWLAALALGLKPVAKEESYDFAQGVDRSLEARARAARKPVKAFETLDQQMQMFASLPEELEVAYLVQTLDKMVFQKSVVDRMLDAWMAGELSVLETMSAELKTSAPEFYDQVFVRRNMDWCDQIAGIMNGAGTSFIAVGAGHMIGDQGVPAILAERGFTVVPY